jgi:hypothetical protein
VKVLEICVLPDVRRIKLIVEMPDPDRFLTSQVPHVPRLLFRLIPSLAQHTCHNDLGLTFRQECRRTEIPHLFEHLIIELQSQAQPEEVLRGETEWNWRVDPRGRFHVFVDYENELLAVGAIRLAERLLVALDRRDIGDIDIESEIVRLRDLARLGRELCPSPIAAPAPDAAEAPARTSWSAVSLANAVPA